MQYKFLLSFYSIVKALWRPNKTGFESSSKNTFQALIVHTLVGSTCNHATTCLDNIYNSQWRTHCVKNNCKLFYGVRGVLNWFINYMKTTTVVEQYIFVIIIFLLKQFIGFQSFTFKLVFLFGKLTTQVIYTTSCYY